MCVFSPVLPTITGPPQEVSNCTFTVQRANEAVKATKKETAESETAAQRSTTLWGSPADEGEAGKETPTADMLTESTTRRRNHSATLLPTADEQKQHQHPQPQHPHHSAVPTVRVRCVGGRDGGQAQTFHLIGLVSAETPGNTALMDRAHESQHQPQQQHVGNVSSIIELIQSIQSSGSVPTKHTEYSQQQQQQRPPSVHWNVSANEVAQFVLVNVTVGQHYDLIIYSQNLIGRSAPLLYRNLLLLNGKPLGDALQHSLPSFFLLSFFSFFLSFIFPSLRLHHQLTYSATLSIFVVVTSQIDFHHCTHGFSSFFPLCPQVVLNGLALVCSLSSLWTYVLWQC